MHSEAKLAKMRDALNQMFGTDRDYNDQAISDLIEELSDATIQVFEHYGFYLKPTE